MDSPSRNPPRLEGPAPEAAAAGVTPSRTVAPFVGREREMEELLAGLEGTLSGQGRLFLLSGEPGIGKTRLADELAARARGRGLRVLWGRCWEAGGAPPYWPWVQAIRSYLRDQNPEAIRSRMGAGAPDMAQMLPELTELFPDLPPPPALDPEAARFRLFDGAATFLRNAARDQPLALILDDLHAADTPSLLLLQFVARELADAPILVMGAYRDVDPTLDDPLAAAVAQLVREPITHLIALSGLTEDEVARFIEMTAGLTSPRSLVGTIQRETEGNPLFLGEVVRLLVQEGRFDELGDATAFRLTVPQGVREVIGRRLTHLSEEGRGVLTLASVLGREFGLDALERVTGRSASELLAILDEATATRVVAEVPGTLGRLRFAHALIRDSLYDDLSTTRRVALHRQLGEVLEALHADDPDPHLAELAHHYFLAAQGRDARDVSRAIECSRRGAEVAAASLAYEEAARLCRMALEALQLRGVADEELRCELLLALGDAQARAGDSPSAKETFVEAAAIARKRQMPERLAEAALGYGGRMVWASARGDRRLVGLLEEALEALGDGDSALRARLLARLVGALRDQPSPERRAGLSDEAVDMARRIGDRATLAYALLSRRIAIWAESPAESLSVATEILRLAEEGREQEMAVNGHLLRNESLLTMGDVEGARAEVEAAALLAAELRLPYQHWHVAVHRAELALLDGRLSEAEERIADALRFGERAHRAEALASAASQTFAVRTEQGRVEEARPAIQRLVADSPGRPFARCLLARMECELGRKEEGRRVFEELATNEFSDLPLDTHRLLSLAVLAEVAASLGDTGRAASLYELLLPHASWVVLDPHDFSAGPASRYLGLLASTMSRWEEAASHFEDALAMNERMRARPWVAHTQHDYARMLLTRDGPGDRERARDLLSAALETALDLGMTALESRVSMLGDAGGAVRPGEVSAPAGPQVFSREGEYWSIAYEGEAFRLKDAKGLRYLARLLAEPGREFHALDVVASGESGESSKLLRAQAEGPGVRSAGLGDAGEVLDRTAIEAYRRRLTDLEDEIEEAGAWADAERSARAREEKGFLEQELASAVGLGGRHRRAASASERARVAVTKAIRSALSRIRENAPSLGRHLDSTVRTGTYCSYRPDPRLPVSWRT